MQELRLQKGLPAVLAAGSGTTVRATALPGQPGQDCLVVCPPAFTPLLKSSRTLRQVLMQPGSESVSVWDADERVPSNQNDGAKWDTLATSKLPSL